MFGVAKAVCQKEVVKNVRRFVVASSVSDYAYVLFIFKSEWVSENISY